MFDKLGIKPDELSALASVGSVVAALIVACVGFYVAWRVAKIPVAVQVALDAARRESEKRQNAVRLTDHVYSMSFYKEVAVVVWEIYVKWRYWDGDDGDRYRMAVVTGYVHYGSKYKLFKKPDELVQGGHNLIRFGDHFHPHDYSPQGQTPNYVQTVLSEHQALTCWLEFWGNVNTMIDQQLIDMDATKQLLSDWYQYWLEMVIELRHIVKTLHTRRNSGKMLSDQEQEPTPRWVIELEQLEARFYTKPDGQLFPWYRSRVEAGSKRAEAILSRLELLDPVFKS